MKQIYAQIYDRVFSNIKKGNIDVFLCGAASTKDKKSVRDSLRQILTKTKRLSILYPEDLFMELLNRKKYDLLTLEKFLATNSDFIVVVCESPGSFTELGAFVNNNDTVDKVIVLLQTKYKNAKSFIRQGPVEFVASKNKNHIIYYNSNYDEAATNIRKLLLKRGRFPKDERIAFKDLNVISGQYNFVLLLLFFYKRLSVKKMVEFIKTVFLDKKYQLENFDIIYTAAIRRLFKEGLIAKNTNDNGEPEYLLTKKGYNNALMLLSYVDLKNRNKVFDDIRMKIMYNENK